MRSFILACLALAPSLLAQQPPYDVFPDAAPPYYRVRYEASTQAGELIFPVNYTVWVPPGVKELREMLAKNPDQLARGVTRHLLTYATGQPATPLDQATIDAIVKGAAKEDFGLRSLVHGVVQSELFRSK